MKFKIITVIDEAHVGHVLARIHPYMPDFVDCQIIEEGSTPKAPLQLPSPTSKKKKLKIDPANVSAGGMTEIILRVVSQSNPTTAMTDINTAVESAGMKASSAYTLMNKLIKGGLVERVVPGYYKPGPNLKATAPASEPTNG